MIYINHVSYNNFFIAGKTWLPISRLCFPSYKLPKSNFVLFSDQESHSKSNGRRHLECRFYLTINGEAPTSKAKTLE